MLRLAAETNVSGAKAVMNDLTLDMCILISGSGLGNKVYGKSCRYLMREMVSRENYYLALDDGRRILSQYLRNLKNGVFGYHFIEQMLSREKIVIIPWLSLKRSVAVALREKGFTQDNEDFKFVVVASGTECHKLVSHDPHFFNVQRILKRIPVIVLWPSEA